MDMCYIAIIAESSDIQLIDLLLKNITYKIYIPMQISFIHHTHQKFPVDHIYIQAEVHLSTLFWIDVNLAYTVSIDTKRIIQIHTGCTLADERLRNLLLTVFLFPLNFDIRKTRSREVAK